MTTPVKKCIDRHVLAGWPKAVTRVERSISRDSSHASSILYVQDSRPRKNGTSETDRSRSMTIDYSLAYTPSTPTQRELYDYLRPCGHPKAY